MSNFENRLERLERGARRWRLAAVALAAVLAVVLFKGAADKQAGESITVRLIRIVDDQGREVGIIAGMKDGSALTLGNADDKSAVVISSSAAMSQLAVNDASGETLAIVKSSKDGGAMFINHPNGKPAMGILPIKGGVTVMTKDDKGGDIWNAPVAAPSSRPQQQ